MTNHAQECKDIQKYHESIGKVLGMYRENARKIPEKYPESIRNILQMYSESNRINAWSKIDL